MLILNVRLYLLFFKLGFNLHFNLCLKCPLNFDCSQCDESSAALARAPRPAPGDLHVPVFGKTFLVFVASLLHLLLLKILSCLTVSGFSLHLSGHASFYCLVTLASLSIIHASMERLSHLDWCLKNLSHIRDGIQVLRNLLTDSSTSNLALPLDDHVLGLKSLD